VFQIISGCQTSSVQEPIQIKPACPAEISAEIRPEPIAPHEAITNDAGRDWLAIDFLPWARENARRLNEGRSWCLRGAK
jgi:hypothetical protein